MRIGFVVNDVLTEKATYTTTRLAMQATTMGHEAWLIGMGNFAYEPDGSLSARARGVTGKNYRSLERYLDDVQKPEVEERVTLSEMDVVMLRSDPADDAHEAAWANNAGVAFGQLIASTGVLVVNDPGSLANALSKAYFQHFPEVVRPRTLISRDREQIASFVSDLGGRAVLKPLQGSGGSGVFLVNTDESPNLNQIIEAIARDGYVVTQEYLEEAKNGDVRMFVMNGKPLVVNGKYAAFRRKSSGSDIRSNMSAGGEAFAVKVTDEMLAMVDVVRPKLVADGMFLVGLDIVGDKLMEVNVFSPGGLGSCQSLYEENFSVAIIEDLERKLDIRRHNPGIGNVDLATL
ncbi:glutathione synthetase [Tessaracoccus lapidicaptus]|uniref:Glutathione synthetase n=1 Tax=Tessaracoccus lapidicaptus TaxID=1427523 RepID=A0A1C0AMJ0_9ACTN|nr:MULTISPECIES: glutathione synthetase [Tessaracoccus]AQX15544.1 glutathione synthetase [Tessaracoccus sp. T2.5-30]OCL33913.1 glutathione synthetase [Tessaracoccus lapidicaptus]VEP39881.1 Glutathione synthetase [Tessaracoccus lapidicaptus]